MPVDLTRARAKISGYGPNRNNDALNALVHVLATKMNDVPNPDHDRDATRRLLCNTFSEEWGTKLDWNQLTAVLRETHDPLHKEMLLGPALRRMLPEEERVASAEISPESVAKLAQKFNIRVESYETVEGAQARIKAELLRDEPPLPSNATLVEQQAREDLLRRKAREQYQQELRTKGKTEADIQAIMANPEGRNALEDRIEGDANRQAANHDCVATLRIVREKSDYRFEALNADGADPNDRIVDTTVHNSAKSYETPCDYEQTAPVLRQELQALLNDAGKAAVAANPNNPRLDIQETLSTGVSKVFTEYQSSLAQTKGSQTTDKGGFGGAIKGLLGDGFGNILEIFGPIMELFKGLFGSLPEMMNDFQEKMLEMAKKPGDALSKKELKEYEARSAALGEAARVFSTGIAALGENNTTAKLLNEKFRKSPDAPEVWVDLMQALMKDDQLDEAELCLQAQEDRLVEIANHIGASSDQDMKDGIAKHLDEYFSAVGPLRDPNLSGPLANKSFVARLNLFQELDGKVKKLSDQHAKVKDTQEKQQKLKVENAIAQAQGAPLLNFNDRLQQLQGEFNILQTAEQASLAACSLEKVEQRQGWWTGQYSQVVAGANLKRCQELTKVVEQKRTQRLTA